MWNHIEIIQLLKKQIPFSFKIILIRVLIFFYMCYYRIFFKRLEWKKGKKIFVLLGTDYSNLGDHAMTYAQIVFLKKNFPGYHIYEVLLGDTLKYLQDIKNNIQPNDIITLKGGGNVGLEYFREEMIRRIIISTFTNNKVIMFPETVYFPKTKQGNIELYKTVNVFNKHERLYTFFRDICSFEIMKPYVKKNMYLSPDIVFSLKDMYQYKENPNGALLCMRNDVEGIYTEDVKKRIYKILTKKFDENVLVVDTVVKYKIDPAKRLDSLKDIWRKFANAKLVITDRLHGMIFSILLGTPCIVLDTYNYKLRGQYEWVKRLNYVYCVDFDERILDETIDIAINTQVNLLNSDRFDFYFDKIVECINKIDD